jgi:hypothetical protein
MDAEPAPMGHGRPFGAARWSGAGVREPRSGPARSNGFGYFPRKESDPAVKAGTKRTGSATTDMPKASSNTAVKAIFQAPHNG